MRYLFIAIIAAIATCLKAQEKKVLTLKECIEIAIENNLNVQRSQLNLQTAKINLVQANAQRYPSLSASGGYGFSWGRSINPNSNLFVNERINTASVGANASLPLLQGFQISNSIKRSEIDLKASGLDLQKAKNDLSLNVASSFLTVILNKELVENAKLQLESSKQQLEQTKILVATGARPLANELQLESQVATNEVTLITNQNNLDLSLLALSQTLLIEPNEQIDVVAPDIEEISSDIEIANSREAYEYALNNQPEIKAADTRVESSSLALEVSRGALYPSLNLNGNINTNYSNAVDKTFVPDGGDPVVVQNETNLQTTTGVSIVQFDKIPSGQIQDYGVLDQWDDNLRYSLSLGLSIPILNGFRNRSNVQRAKVNLQQSEIDAKDERNRLYQTIETAYRNALATSRSYVASQKQVSSLEEAYRAVENQYTNGAANFIDYQVAANNFFRAQSDLLRAKYDFIFRKKILDFYLGKPLSF